MAKNYDGWLKRAVIKDKYDAKERPELAQVTEGWASDRFRLHRLAGAPVPACHKVWTNAEQLLARAKAGETKVAVSAEQFKSAVKAARVFSKNAILHFGDILQVGAANPELGEARTDLADDDFEYVFSKGKNLTCTKKYVAYGKIGPDVFCHFNAIYLLDALAGMGDELTLALAVQQDDVYMVYLTSENGNEALVCGMDLDTQMPRFEGDPPEPAVNAKGYCKHCGREYDDVQTGPCPSDDCPSHDPGDGTTNPYASEPTEPEYTGSDWVPDPVVHDLPEAV
jgi:hypothetical protein